MIKATTFFFESYHFHTERGELVCRYHFNSGEQFEERLIFPPRPPDITQALPDQRAFSCTFE